MRDTHQIPYSFVSGHFTQSAGPQARQRKGSVPTCSYHTQPGPGEQHPTAAPEGVSALPKAAERATEALGKEMALSVSLPRDSGADVAATGRPGRAGGRLLGKAPWGGGWRCLPVTPSQGSGDGRQDGPGPHRGWRLQLRLGRRSRGARQPSPGSVRTLPAGPSGAPTTSWRHSLGGTLRPSPWASLSAALGGRAVGLGTGHRCAGEGSEGGPRVLLTGHLSKAVRSHRSPITGGETEAQRGRGRPELAGASGRAASVVQL